MNARIGNSSTNLGRIRPVDTAELAEIHSIPDKISVLKPREALAPGEKAASLLPDLELPNAVAPLTAVLGKRLTSDNPVWSGDPIPTLRLLQKTLVMRSLELEPEARAELLSAIDLVEKAVQMRLRWQQMRRSELEPESVPAESATQLSDLSE